MCPFTVQGQWLVRASLAALAAGIDRATLFELDDTCKLEEHGTEEQLAADVLAR